VTDKRLVYMTPRFQGRKEMTDFLVSDALKDLTKNPNLQERTWHTPLSF
jgi:hypothetical protein